MFDARKDIFGNKPVILASDIEKKIIKPLLKGDPENFLKFVLIEEKYYYELEYSKTKIWDYTKQDPDKYSDFYVVSHIVDGSLGGYDQLEMGERFSRWVLVFKTANIKQREKIKKMYGFEPLHVNSVNIPDKPIFYTSQEQYDDFKRNHTL